MKFTRFLISRPLLTSMFFVALGLLGVVAYFRIPVAELPNINYPTVVVAVSDPGSDSTTVQQSVTAPIEQAINGVSGLTQVIGVSRSGASRVVASFATGTSVQVAAQQISAVLGRVQRHLPASASTADVTTINPNLAPLLQVQFVGIPNSQLVQLLDTTVAPDLRLVPGVGQINVAGGSPTQVNVVINPQDAAALGVSITQIDQALSSQNILKGTGTTINGGQASQVILDTRSTSTNQLGKLVVGQNGKMPVILSQIASITTGSPPSAFGNSYSTLNGKPTVALSVIPADGVNQIALDAGIRAKLATIAPTLPPSVHYVVASDQTVFTKAALSATVQDIVFAIMLASLVILLFLQSGKQTLIVFIAIPSSLLATLFMMYLLHFTLDLISLLAFTLLIGILVDDAVVVIENITRHLHMGLPPSSAALEGRKEIAAAAIALTLTDVVVFLPITFASGIVGQILIEFGVTVVFATLFSLLVSFSLTPMLAAKLLKSPQPMPLSNQKGTGVVVRVKASLSGYIEGFQDKYERALVAALRHKALLLLVGAITVAGSVALVTTGRVGSSYVPQEDPGQINVALQMPSGTTLAGTSDAVTRFSTLILKELPGVKDVVVSVGNGAGGLVASSSQGSATIDLVPKNQRSTSITTEEKLVSLIGESIPGLKAVPSVPSPLKTPGSSGLPIQISGPNLNTVETLSQIVDQKLQGLPGLSSAVNTTTKSSPEWTIAVNQYEARLYGVSTAAISSTLSTAIGGSQVSSLQSPSGIDLPVYLYISGAPHLSLAELENIPVTVGSASSASSLTNQSGAGAVGTSTTKALASSTTPPAPVSLGQITTITHGIAPSTIKDQNGEPSATVQGVLSGTLPLSQVTAEVNSALSTMSFPSGYQYSLGGNAAAQKVSFGPLLLALGLSPLFIYILLAALYESFLLPLAVILGVPLATFGALAALALTQQSLNIFSLIGGLMLLGLVSKNAILLIDYTETLRSRGMSSLGAVVLAARTRVRPIIMTTLTVVIAMLPVAFLSSAGSEYRSPMALVLVGGMTSSTLLTLFLIPALYVLLDSLRKRLRGGVDMPPRGYLAIDDVGQESVTLSEAH